MCSQQVSIIVLSYNNLNYHQECIDSIMMQDYKNIELIISDDCSEAFNNKEICSYIEGKKKSNIRNVIINHNLNNMGTVKNANKAIGLSSGKYIKLIAVDDRLFEETTISKIANFMEKANALLCTGYVNVYDEHLREVKEIRPGIAEVEVLKKGDALSIYEMFCISGGFIPAAGTTYSRKFFEVYGHFDERYLLLEDKPTLAKALRLGCNVSFLEETVAMYRLGGVSSFSESNICLQKDRAFFQNNEVLPHIGISLKDYGKEYVVWGTKTKYYDNRAKLLAIGFKYFVDSDIAIQGNEIDGKRIYPPERLMEEKSSEIIVIVCSAYFLEISKWLTSNGFKNKESYINVNLVREF